jgi:hypothetical protein
LQGSSKVADYFPDQPMLACDQCSCARCGECLFHKMHCDDRPPIPECWGHDLLGAYASSFCIGKH